jgi:3-isopropylmalate dehydrogenase
MTYRLAVIGGDGVGPEVTDQALKAIRAASTKFGFEIKTESYDLGGRRFLTTGEVLPASVQEELSLHEAILLGAVGTPDVPPGVLERGLLLKLRFDFDLYINLRPVKLYPGVPSPIAELTPDRCDLVVIRENTEGLYVGAGGIARRGTPHEIATQESINTRFGVERACRFAFEQAMGRRRRLTLCHKTNVLTFAGDLWQRTFHEVAADYPDVAVDYVHVDAACLYLVQSPERFDVIVTDNLFGDIVTDLGAAVQGGLGLAASGNLNPDRTGPSLFEPVHGSAPDIVGTGRANPLAAIRSAAMMLHFLGESAAASGIYAACRAADAEVLNADNTDTTTATTTEIGDFVAERVRAHAAAEG